MLDKHIYIGKNKITKNDKFVKGDYHEIDGETFYKISNYNKMDPFFMSIVSSSDHWLFISSNGGLTAGRKNPDNALFPYYNDDIIHDSNEKTGSKSIFKIEIGEDIFLWEPFSNNYQNIYDIERNIYKNIPGNKILFEEINNDLGISFSYYWLNSEKFGFVKKSKIKNINSFEVKVEYLDGIQNILPFGIYQQFQTEFSTLTDGYKKNELIPSLGIGVFSLSSIPSDKAEPSEALKATTVWSTGVKADKYLLSSRQLNDYRACKIIETETNIKAARGAYFINGELTLGSNKSEEWIIVADINQDSSALNSLVNSLENDKNIFQNVIEDVEDGTEKLIKIVSKSDGLQLTNNRLGTSRHFANVLFNVMRGGIFDDSYLIDRDDFILFLNSTNKIVLKRHKEFIELLDKKNTHSNLVSKIKGLNDSELIKLSLEYLPLTFSRRHGDPSRPWNRFSIDIKNDKNEKVLNYQGNWRDIFQNWEALALSYPGYIESMLTKFLNASTADGYNPYRVTRDGFDWESPEPDMAWSNIGYWGDHQIIYLLKLLELSSKHNPSKLLNMISDDIFTYANIPYRIKDYNDLLSDPHNTIDFDFGLHKKISSREKIIGSDARFLSIDDKLIQVNLSEKLLATLLSKLSNFIPDAGIWMNTQRPEWNDANNALVGNGVSMVTLYYIRRYLAYLIELFSNLDSKSLLLSEEICILFEDIAKVLSENEDKLEKGISDKERKLILDGLGKAASVFRSTIYEKGFTANKNYKLTVEIISFLKVAQKFVESTIKSNRRSDGLYNSYNLMSVENNDEIIITNLYEMLEGQVAVLSSGYLQTEEAIELLKVLRESPLYREDQNSYILYPNRELPLFIEKNIISNNDYNSSYLFQKLVELGNNNIVIRDINGKVHFNGEIKNAKILKSKLKEIEIQNIPELNEKEIDKALSIYESVFNHKYFTGRSGTFYKYEGLGSIYWHMVSKLVLAVQETFLNAKENNASQSDLAKLKNFYYEIKEGIGVNKSPENYGAFPTDPYSHTPSFSGVQQPGMTGQVKEDVISRFGELGIKVVNNKIIINNDLLKTDEFLSTEMNFIYYDVQGKKNNFTIPSNSLAFTYCQVPFVYSQSDESKITVHKKNNVQIELNKLVLDEDLSNSIFNRDGNIEKITVSFSK